jgi:hypothetical protein
MLTIGQMVAIVRALLQDLACAGLTTNLPTRIYVIDIVAVTAFWIVILIIQRSLTPSYQRTTLQATRHALLNIDHSAEHRPELCRWCGTVYTPSGRRPTFAMCDACGMYIVLEELFVAAALTTVGNVGSWMSLDNSVRHFVTVI